MKKIVGISTGVLLALVLVVVTASGADKVAARQERIEKTMAAADSIVSEGNNLSDLRFYAEPCLSDSEDAFYAAVVAVGFDSVRSALLALKELNRSVSVASDSAFNAGLGRAAETLMVVNLVYMRTAMAISAKWREFIQHKKVVRSVRST